MAICFEGVRASCYWLTTSQTGVVFVCSRLPWTGRSQRMRWQLQYIEAQMKEGCVTGYQLNVLDWCVNVDWTGGTFRMYMMGQESEDNECWR